MQNPGLLYVKLEILSGVVTIVSCLFFAHLFICAYIVWAISPPTSHTFPSPLRLPLLSGRICSTVISNFDGESINNNQINKSFLAVEIRIAIQGDS
jgi:hypothetical protein